MTTQRAYCLGGPLNGKHIELTGERERIYEHNGERDVYRRILKVYGYIWDGKLKEHTFQTDTPPDVVTIDGQTYIRRKEETRGIRSEEVSAESV